MINNGDKILVCLSGGKDSLSLLHALLQYQSHVQNKGIAFTLGAVTINPQTSESGYGSFLAHVRSFGIHYIIDALEDDKESSGSYIFRIIVDIVVQTCLVFSRIVFVEDTNALK